MAWAAILDTPRSSHSSATSNTFNLRSRPAPASFSKTFYGYEVGPTATNKPATWSQPGKIGIETAFMLYATLYHLRLQTSPDLGLGEIRDVNKDRHINWADVAHKSRPAEMRLFRALSYISEGHGSHLVPSNQSPLSVRLLGVNAKIQQLEHRAADRSRYAHCFMKRSPVYLTLRNWSMRCKLELIALANYACRHLERQSEFNGAADADEGPTREFVAGGGLRRRVRRRRPRGRRCVPSWERWERGASRWRDAGAARVLGRRLARTGTSSTGAARATPGVRGHTLRDLGEVALDANRAASTLVQSLP
ncbi:hypothetical protein FIBSPDRAFT_938791 [Athelia psychrophila]|uniref:Uncharacterized protein n=1 Tax=Athelia psychrophila TaxID=1759441 RepID=A0A165XRX9_9AGAM|nr:hypothetical protein FIBSPDRAFT_938791 [Fibularhizoctonia sp. CBS 109695]